MITLTDLYIFNIILSLIFIRKKDKGNFFVRFILSLLLPYFYLFIFVVPRWVSALFNVIIVDDDEYIEEVEEYNKIGSDKLEHEMIVPYLDIVYFGSVKDKREYLKNVSVNHDNILQIIKIVLAFINDTDSEVKLYASSALSGVKEILPKKLEDMKAEVLTEDVLIQQFNILVTLYENEIYDRNTISDVMELLNKVMDKMVETSIFEYHIEVVQFCMKNMPSRVDKYMYTEHLSEEEQDFLELDYAFYIGDKLRSREIIRKYKNKVVHTEQLVEILGMFGG